MKICKNCEEKNSVITVTEVDKKGKKTVTHFCNNCGNRSDRIEDIVREEKE